jgi:hypothetical protein
MLFRAESCPESTEHTQSEAPDWADIAASIEWPLSV